MTTYREPDSLMLEYRLHELPTAQHKAGLAGLLLMVDELKNQGVSKIPAIKNQKGMDEVQVDLTYPSLQRLFDELYAAEYVEEAYDTKSSDKNFLREEEVPDEDADASGKMRKQYIYKVFRPQGLLFQRLLGDNAAPWIKLWQKMLWSVLRAQSKARGDYESYAKGQVPPLATNMWKQLLKESKERAEGRVHTESIAGSLYISAQNRNAERVDFQGPPHFNFLLHFWQLASPIFVPQVVDIKQRRQSRQGYLLAIPEVAEIDEFIQDIRDYWRSRLPDKRGSLPKQAFLDVPEQGGLEFLCAIGRCALDDTVGVGNSILSVEWYHQEKRGNNVRMHANGRIYPDSRLLRKYAQVRNQENNPQMKELLIRNLLARMPWHENVHTLFANYPTEFFFQSGNSPRWNPFGLSARNRMKEAINRLTMEPENMSDPTFLDERLIQRVYHLIGNFVRQRSEDRSGIAEANLPKDENNYPKRPRELLDVRKKVALDAFLSMRSRNGNDFVEYFTGTICSVPQFFGREQGFVELSRAMIEMPDTIKNLSMLALCAHAWAPSDKKESDKIGADK